MDVEFAAVGQSPKQSPWIPAFAGMTAKEQTEANDT